MIISLSRVLESLSFGVDSELFEKNLNELGRILGLKCSRPEYEGQNGPDNLWCIRNKYFWVISCKNEVRSDRSYISKSDVGQMSSDVAWFKQNYEGEGEPKPVFIHRATKLDTNVAISYPLWVITESSLNELKRNILNFYNSFRDFPRDRMTTSLISQNLKKSSLRFR